MDCSIFISLELAHVEMIVETPLSEKRFVVALFDDFAVIDDDNAISVADCTQPVAMTMLVRLP